MHERIKSITAMKSQFLLDRTSAILTAFLWKTTRCLINLVTFTFLGSILSCPSSPISINFNTVKKLDLFLVTLFFALKMAPRLRTGNLQ